MSEEAHNQTMQLAEVHDPVCGMKVRSIEGGGKLEHQGATVYFCSQGCAAKFRAAPEKYTRWPNRDATPEPPAKTGPQR